LSGIATEDRTFSLPPSVILSLSGITTEDRTFSLPPSVILSLSGIATEDRTFSLPPSVILSLSKDQPPANLRRWVKTYFVYILSNCAATLYIGVTGNLDFRLFQHGEHHDPDSFVSRYDLDRLVFVEDYPDARQAIAREKQLKGWSRAKKLHLIRRQNPEWKNLLAHANSNPTNTPSGG
jgi:putative endonuclease